MKRNFWETGWKTTFTRHKFLDFKGLLLLFTLLFFPEPTRGTNHYGACVKHALSEPLTKCHGLFDDMKRHQVYLRRMQKSIDEAMTSFMRYSEDYQEVLDIVYKGNGSYRAIKINEVENGKSLPAPLPITEDMRSKGKRLGELDSSTAKMGQSAQDGLNHSFEFLVIECSLGFMMILFYTLITWIEGKKLDLIELEDCPKDEKKECRPLNNIQATAQTGNRDQDKLLSSLAGSMSPVKLPLVCTPVQFDCEKYVYSGHLSYKSLHEAACTSPMPVKDLWYKEYRSSLTPSLPNISTIDFQEPRTSKCIFSTENIKTFLGTDYCKDNTNFKQLSADNGTCRLEHFVNDTDVSTVTCLKKCLVEVPSDSEGTSFEDSDCTKSITSSYPIQSRSLSDRKTSLYTSSLSSHVPSGQTGEMKESPVKKCDLIFEDILEESLLETENLLESEKKQPLQIPSLSQQHIDGDMKSRNITEHEWLESEQQETDEGHVDFFYFESNCVTDSEDDFQIILQSGKVDAYSRNIKESHCSQSTTNNSGYRSVVENHSLITLEEFYNAHYVQENSDRQIPVETANFQKEKESTYPAFLKGNIYVGNIKENYSLENMKGFTISETDRKDTNSGKTMVRSQNFQENAKITEENASFQNCRHTTKSANYKSDSSDLNVNVHAFPQNADDNVDMQNVQEKTNLHNVEESSNLQKVTVDIYSQNIKGNSYAYVKKDGHCHIDKGNGMCLTGLNPPTGANEDKSVPMEEKSFINVRTKQLDSAESKVEASEVEDTSRISCFGTREFEYFQKYDFNVIVNAPPQNAEENADMPNVQENYLRNVQESQYLQKVKEDVHLQSVKGNANVHVKKDSNYHIYKGKEGCLTHSNGPTGENQDKSVSVTSQSSLSEDEGFSEKSVQMVCKSYTLEKVEEEDISLIRLNKEWNLEGNNKQFTNLNTKEKDGKLHVNDSSEETVEETIEGDIIRIKDEIKVQDNIPLISDEVEEASGRSTISENEGFSSESFEIDSKCFSQEDMQVENVSQFKINRERISKRIDEQLESYKIEAEVLKPYVGLEEFLPTDRKINERDLTWTKNDIKVDKTLSVILDEAETASISRTITEDKVVTEKSVEQGNKCLKQENVKEVSFATLRGEKESLNEVNCDCEKNTLKDRNIFEANITEKSEKIEKRCAYSHKRFENTEVCDSTKHEFETEKGDIVHEQKPDSFAVHDNVEDKESQVQPVVKQKIGHTEPDITGEKVKCGAPPYLCSPKQVADTVGCTQPCLTSNFKTDNKDRDPGLKMIKYGSPRGPNSQVRDPSENMINEFDVKLKRKLGNECHQKQNPSLGLWMKIPSVACGLKSVSHQRLKKSAGFQKKHRYLSRLKNRRNSDSNRVNIDLVSYKTDESDSGLLHTAEHKTKDYSNAICKAQRKPWTKKAHRDHSYITGESSFLKNRQKNLFGKVRKLPQFLQNRDFLFPFLQSPQRNSDLDKDAKLKSAIRKLRLRQSHLYRSKEQCSSFDKPSDGGFEMQQGLPKPMKLETNVTKMKSRIILNGWIKWRKRKHRITRSGSWTSYDRSLLKLGDTSDTSQNPSFESSSTDIFVQNLRPELDQVILQTVGESIDSDLGTIESYRSDVVVQMEILEGAFHDNEVKLSSKNMRNLKRKLRKKESKIELSAGYRNAVFHPLYFRPQLSNVIVYPGLQRYFERLQEDPASHEESLSYEWLRLESLRNYHGAGSIIRLAQGGFYHDPVDGQLSTRCYACNALYTNWEFFDNVTEVHRRLSPNCPHLRENASESVNVSIDNEQMNNQPNRTGSSVTVETPEERANESDSQSATTVNSITDSLGGTRIRDILPEQRRNAEQQAQERQEAKNMSQDPMATTAAQALLEMGYSRERTNEAI